MVGRDCRFGAGICTRRIAFWTVDLVLCAPSAKLSRSLGGASTSIRMPDWIAKANIEHFKRLLETEKDPRKRAMIERELAEEEAKLAALRKQAERKEG